MIELTDIPTKWYLKAFLLLVRLLRKNRWTRRVIVRSFKDRIMLGPLTRIHVKAIHDIRTIAVNKDSLPDKSLTYEALESVANSCRDAVSEILEIEPNHIHCTVKLCGGNSNNKAQWKVYTIARSNPCHRPAEYGMANYHLVGKNSSFAALVGCNDRKNKWEPHVFSCFACSNLKKYTHYDCSRDNWQNYFNSTVVFPLRYRKIGEKYFTTLGFLTFDSLSDDAFGEIPCIFDHQHDYSTYQQKLDYSSLYQLGGILADVLAVTFYPLVDKHKEIARK